MPRQVDIFIPVSPQPVGPRKPSELSRIASAQRVPTVNNDVIRPSGRKPPLDHLRPRYPRPLSQVTTPPVVPRKQQPVPPSPLPSVARPQSMPIVTVKSKKTLRRGRRAAKLAVVGSAMLAIGMLLQAAVYGELLIAVYAIFALVRRVESRTTFMLALISLGCILVMLLLRPNLELMQNFAIYAFLLLLVGTVSLTTETRH